MNKILGIDIGGTYTRYGVVENENVLSVNKIRTREIKDIKNFIASLARNYSDIAAISIGIPGIVQHNKIKSIPNIHAFEIENLDVMLKEVTHKNIYINKDVNLLFVHDLNRLALENERNVLAFYLGTGLGNALKINGELLTGHHGFSGELGHIPIIGNTRECGCGKIGCSETIVSGKALIRLFEDHQLDGSYDDLFINHLDHPAVQTFLYQFAQIIGIELNILDVNHIIIGGGVVNMNAFPQTLLKQFIIEQLRTASIQKDFYIHFVDDSPSGSIIGAALIIRSEEQ